MKINHYNADENNYLSYSETKLTRREPQVYGYSDLIIYKRIIWNTDQNPQIYYLEWLRLNEIGNEEWESVPIKLYAKLEKLHKEAYAPLSDLQIIEDESDDVHAYIKNMYLY